MYLKLIACEVLCREVCLCISRSMNTIDVEFTKKDSHDYADYLRTQIQDQIDQASDGEYDAIILGYGLCGGAAVGLEARETPVVIPRAHDCCTLFLGSKEKFREHFADNPSLPFSSTGYMERGDSYIRTGGLQRTLGLDRTFEEYAAQYGEENAKYIIETLHLGTQVESYQSKVVFIDQPEWRYLGWAEKFQQQAAKDGREYVCLLGDLELVQNLVDGRWDEESFLVVPPYHRIEGVYDWDEICCAEKAGKDVL